MKDYLIDDKKPTRKDKIFSIVVIILLITYLGVYYKSIPKPLKYIIIQDSTEVVKPDPAIKIMKAIAFRESSYRMSVIGDSGTAYGLLQIHECMVETANMISGKNYTLEDCLSPYVSIDIFLIIMNHFNPDMDFEKACRIWNGWDLNCEKESTEKYYNKVLLAMNDLSVRRTTYVPQIAYEIFKAIEATEKHI
jgi:hypothetical protein